MSNSSSRVDDLLWKSILEQTFAHFLRFFFSDADDVFDLSKPFDYLDKEFETLFPPEPNGRGVRFVDKLVKVHLKDGGMKYVLCHIEVQSSKGKGDLAERMFQYYYKVYDKYKVPITAIAILVDDNVSYKPSSYKDEFMGTSIQYNFNCYKILDQEEALLRDDANPFAVVVLTTLLAIKNKKVSDEKLKHIKHDLYDQMVIRNMDRSTRQSLYDFLTYYVRFDNQLNLSIFESEIYNQSGKESIMGTKEYLLDKAKKEGIASGIEKGRLEERAKLKTEKRVIALEFKKMGLPLADIAKGTGLSIEEIEKL
ncbi:hypothetical protein KO02_04810 [Sphingobacterium sp. ML3W]|uniref:hypothetical protein n=1 Tax=Sphingobacterium TaxID=28453 RepID=UPI0004F82810|nr:MULTISPECIES: hypothetical protein [Sphingobacterium]AIM36087.1 hypothetical protein KO02_04810 [Sphingobacterium sp. ML3W]MDH5827778.1 hypothetical protein [Sphingobacterium faecium]